MTVISGFPWAMNQPVPEGYGYSAESLRAQHFDSTSGGNGVGDPTALKVSAQVAPNETIRTTPGGVTAVSTYAGHRGQSYHALFGAPETVAVSPTGSSSGGRTDLVVAQFCDPEYEKHWSHTGEYPIPADVAKDLDFQRIHVLEGQGRNARLTFPHVKLAEIKRPANTTIVNASHITDLRQLAKPQFDRIKRIQNVATRMEVPRTGTGRLLVEFLVEVPEWATRANIDASIGGAYFRGASGRGRMGIAAFNNSSHNEATPWWEEGGSTTGFRRIPYIQAGRELWIHPDYRGTIAQVLVQGVVDTWSDSGFIFGVDAGARAFLDIDWMQDVE